MEIEPGAEEASSGDPNVETFAESSLEVSLAAEAARLSAEIGVPADVAFEEVAQAADELLAEASVQTFIPLLAGRLAKERLEEQAGDEDTEELEAES